MQITDNEHETALNALADLARATSESFLAVSRLADVLVVKPPPSIHFAVPDATRSMIANATEQAAALSRKFH